MREYVESATVNGEFIRNRSATGWPVKTESEVLPSGSGYGLMELSEQIHPGSTLTAKLNGVPAELVPYSFAPTEGVIGVDRARGILKYNRGEDGGKTLEFTYTPSGTVVSAGTMQRLAGIPANLARLDAAQNWTALQTFDERPIVDDGMSLPEGGSPVLTGDDPLNAGLLIGTVPLARMHANVARRDVANTFAQPQTFNAQTNLKGVVYPSRTISSNATLLLTDYYLSLAPHGGAFTVSLPSVTAGIGQTYYGEFFNNSSGNAVTFDAGVGYLVSAAGSHAQSYVGPTSSNNRWFRIVKINALTWSISTGVIQ